MKKTRIRREPEGGTWERFKWPQPVRTHTSGCRELHGNEFSSYCSAAGGGSASGSAGGGLLLLRTEADCTVE